MTRHRRIGDQRQAYFAIRTGRVLLWFIRKLARREESVQGQFQNLFAGDLGLKRAADERGSATKHRNLDALKIRIGKKLLLGGCALPAQGATLANRQLLAELRFRQPG